MSAVLLVTACGSNGASDRQATVASVGAEVMPFDLERTTHTFTKTPAGGVQRVTADDPDDAVQVELIREHLRDEHERFARGDFDDPARIHGMDMPGVAELRRGYRDVAVSYRERDHGAELVYRTVDPALVEAVHQWFDRQVMDHGEHATAG